MEEEKFITIHFKLETVLLWMFKTKSSRWHLLRHFIEERNVEKYVVSEKNLTH